MGIKIKRIYEKASAEDGYRLLVDQLWPRGLTKEKARVDRWLKEIAPSKELRKWYNHEPEKWPEFKRRYFEELDENNSLVDELIAIIRGRDVTFLFSSKEPELNNAFALKEYIEKKKKI